MTLRAEFFTRTFSRPYFHALLSFLVFAMPVTDRGVFNALQGKAAPLWQGTCQSMVNCLSHALPSPWAQLPARSSRQGSQSRGARPALSRPWCWLAVRGRSWPCPALDALQALQAFTARLASPARSPAN